MASGVLAGLGLGSGARRFDALQLVCMHAVSRDCILTDGCKRGPCWLASAVLHRRVQLVLGFLCVCLYGRVISTALAAGFLPNPWG